MSISKIQDRISVFSFYPTNLFLPGEVKIMKAEKQVQMKEAAEYVAR